LRLPLKSGAFDAVISIAVIHHFSNRYCFKWALICPDLYERQRLMNFFVSRGAKGRFSYMFGRLSRLKNLSQNKMFSCHGIWHLSLRMKKFFSKFSRKKRRRIRKSRKSKKSRRNKKSRNFQMKSHVFSVFYMDIHLEKGTDDYEINDQKKTVVYKRYYHVFRKGELEELLAELTGFSITN
jgi:hypothetical protein